MLGKNEKMEVYVLLMKYMYNVVTVRYICAGATLIFSVRDFFYLNFCPHENLAVKLRFIGLT